MKKVKLRKNRIVHVCAGEAHEWTFLDSACAELFKEYLFKEKRIFKFDGKFNIKDYEYVVRINIFHGSKNNIYKQYVGYFKDKDTCLARYSAAREKYGDYAKIYVNRISLEELC